MRDIPRLYWLNLKTQKKSINNKNKPGRKPELTEALKENESRNESREENGKN